MSVQRFPRAYRRIPRIAVAYPSDYALASATMSLVSEYGQDGAVSRLIEMAERIAAGECASEWVMKRHPVDPWKKP
jgi:hypothetical protein